MNARPKSYTEPATSHGQFYKSDKLVKLICQDFGGFNPGARTVHANGRICPVKFIVTPAAKTWLDKTQIGVLLHEFKIVSSD